MQKVMVGRREEMLGCEHGFGGLEGFIRVRNKERSI